MFLRVSAFVLAVVAVLAVGACTANRVDARAAYEDAAIRGAVGSLPAALYHDALEAIALPDGAVGEGDRVAVYRLPDGRGESPGACYAAEDWLIKRVREAGATPVERSLCAPPLLGEGGPSPEAEPPLSLARATLALGYRIVAAEVWFDPPETKPRPDTVVRAHAQVIVNLRTVDLNTGEIVVDDTVTCVGKKGVTISRLAGFDDWRNWGEGVSWKPRDPEKAPPPETVTPPKTSPVTKSVVGYTTTYAGTLRGNNDGATFDLYTDEEYLEIDFTYPEDAAFYVKVLGKAGGELGEFDLREGNIVELSGGGLFTLVVHSESGGGAWTATYTE